jgi:hypothetical protein
VRGSKCLFAFGSSVYWCVKILVAVMTSHVLWKIAAMHIAILYFLCWHFT